MSAHVDAVSCRAQLTRLTAGDPAGGDKLGAAHPSQFGGNTASFLRMRLVELSGGASGDETIQEHATALRQQLGI